MSVEKKHKVEDESSVAEEGNNLAKIEHLRKSFGNNHVLKDISLNIKKGENLIIMGRSGSGKSVLAKCFVRLIEPDGGKLFAFGKNIAELTDDGLNEVRKKIGFLFQGSALYDSMTVGENLEFPLRNLRTFSEKEIKSRVREALYDVGLGETTDKMPSELSGGMKKRIALARTLIMKPEIIIYDEPTTGLDRITSGEISNLIISVQEKFKTASLIITHDLECARITGNRIIIIENGISIAEGTFKELEKSENKVVREFFGSNIEKNNSHEKVHRR